MCPPIRSDRAFVKVLDEDAREHDALTYRMVGRPTRGRPSFEYVSQIAEAYEREGFSTAPLLRSAGWADSFQTTTGEQR